LKYAKPWLKLDSMKYEKQWRQLHNKQTNHSMQKLEAWSFKKKLLIFTFMVA